MEYTNEEDVKVMKDVQIAMSAAMRTSISNFLVYPKVGRL